MKPKYITPRIAVYTLTPTQDTTKIIAYVQARHKHYHHYFNLTKISINPHTQTHYKWRGIPFSITETIKILTQLDAFLRNNIANSAILCVTNPTMEDFAHFVVKTYLEICCISAQNEPSSIKTLKIAKYAKTVLLTHPYLTHQILKIYKNINLEAPPVKILESLVIEPQHLFIPLIDVMSQARYNDFQEVYSHKIEEQLATYYLNLNKPLQKGIGRRYYDQKPETKYFKKPVAVCGDVKIVVSSYSRLKKEHRFSLGFNTHNIDELNSKNKGVILIEDSDLYQKSNEIKETITVKIQYSDFCDNPKCKPASSCLECKQITKKLANRYSEAQAELVKLSRVRSAEQVTIVLSL